MGARGRAAWLAASTVMVWLAWVAQADAFVYWTSNSSGAIGRAYLDGSGANQAFISGVTSSSLAVDGGPSGTASPSAASLSFGTQALGPSGRPRR